MSNYFDHLLWLTCVADADIIFLSCGFFLLSSFFLRLISAAADWMSNILNSTHGVALVRIYIVAMYKCGTQVIRLGLSKKADIISHANSNSNR